MTSFEFRVSSSTDQERGRRGQTTAEYAVLIAVVVGALLAMQIYVKRGAMGRLKDAADQMGDQFSPSQTTSNFTQTRNVTRAESTKLKVTTSNTTKEVQKTTEGEVAIGGLNAENLF